MLIALKSDLTVDILGTTFRSCNILRHLLLFFSSFQNNIIVNSDIAGANFVKRMTALYRRLVF